MRGMTPEALEISSREARAALRAGRLDEAAAEATEIRRLAIRRLRTGTLEDPHLAAALGASIEVLAQTMGNQGRRPEAVRFIKRELARFGGSPIGIRLRKNLNLLTLEGQPAPELEIREWLGPRPPSMAQLRGQPMLLFFWAHYCEDSRAQEPVLARLRGEFPWLALIGPTRRYGYLDEHRTEPATPRKEKQHIAQTLAEHYAELAAMPVPISEQNFFVYGASTTPTLVLVDASGLVSLYHPGKMPYGELTRRLRRLRSRVT